MSEVNIQTERVDDIPLLIQQQRAMSIAQIIDGVIIRHGNRQGLSVGWTTVGWLTYILSQSDHRLSFVEEWAKNRLQTLSQCIGEPVRHTDFTDDRLGEVVRLLSDDHVWSAIETQLGQQLVQVYQLPSQTARVDATTVSMHHDEAQSELIAYGHSKDHRPDLAQVKVMMTTLDPLSLPIATQIVPGNRADDGLYVPAIAAAQTVLPERGMLYVGDSKMEALSTRAHLVETGDYYLLPLSKKGEQGQLLAEKAAQAVADPNLLTDVYAPTEQTGEQPRLLAQIWETSRKQQALIADRYIEWTERVLLVYSPDLAQSSYASLNKRLQNAIAKLEQLTAPPARGKKQYQELAPLQAKVDTILAQHRVTGLLQVTYHEERTERHVRAYRDRPARTEVTVRYQLGVGRDEKVIAAAFCKMGWRLFVSNAPSDHLPMTEIVPIYRGSTPTIERLFARFKGRPLGLRPVFVRRDDHLKGLFRLLTLALRILTLIEFVVRRSLHQADEAIPGLYPGNASQTTSRPTTERLLRAFQEVTLSIVEMGTQHIRHVTPLSPLQNRILQLLKFSDLIYTELTRVETISD